MAVWPAVAIMPYTAGMQTRLAEIRKKRGLSTYAVAKATGIPRTTLRRMEAGTSPVINRDYVRTLYAFYDYEVDLADIYDPLFDFEVAGAK